MGCGGLSRLRKTASMMGLVELIRAASSSPSLASVPRLSPGPVPASLAKLGAEFDHYRRRELQAALPGRGLPKL
jgi:hypothetical protein